MLQVRRYYQEKYRRKNQSRVFRGTYGRDPNLRFRNEPNPEIGRTSYWFRGLLVPLSRLALALLLAGVSLRAHPMGNFSISHYSRLELEPKGIELTYILDFAEIPTLELFTTWGIDGKQPNLVAQKASTEASVWLQNVSVSVNGQSLTPKLSSVKATTLDGAGGMSVLRIQMQANVPSQPGSLSYEDHNFATRTGWKEIVISKSGAVALADATESDRDISHGLTVYPAELTVTPPQDLRASVKWTTQTQTAPEKPKPAEPVAPTPVLVPATTGTAAPSFAQRQPTASGTVNRGDFLSHMLREKKFDLATILLGVMVALGLGAMHALSPGHGKTIVAAYLVGSRGTLKHAAFLGFMVTFTHTVSVFLLGIGVLFFQKYVVPERVIPVLGAISGLSIIGIGLWLLYKRSKALIGTPEHVHSHHAHDHEEGHPHQHPHHHDHHHDHSHRHEHHDHSHTFTHTHTHDGHTHTHAVPSGGITLGSLVALGASGGLVPCPSALVLLLSAIALGHPGLGLALLTGFSAGLALVLMGIGAMVLYARNLLPQARTAGSHPIARLLPVFSSVVVIVVGLLMTLTAVNLIQPLRLFT